MDIYYGNVSPLDIMMSYSVPHGDESINSKLSFRLLDHSVKSSLQYGVIYGVAIGACLILIFIMWMITQNKKTPIFILNQCTMVLMIIRSLLYISYLMCPLALPSFEFTGLITSDTRDAYKISIAANVVQMLLIATVEALMVYQIFIIFRSPEVKRLGEALTLFASLMGTIIVGFYINSTIKTSLSFEDAFQGRGFTERYNGWEVAVPFILFSASINIMSLNLAFKLFFAIRSRRYLGLRQFDSFHILFIMTTQTMVVPSVLVIVNYGLPSLENDLLSTISILLVVISLPLSTMWASSANNNPTPSSSILAHLNRSTSNYAKSVSSAESKYSFFPEKLSKLSSANTERFLSSLPKTLVSFNSRDISFPENGETKLSAMAVVDLVFDGDSNPICHSLRTDDDRDSVDQILDNILHDNIVSVVKHNFKQ